ncbi:MAG: hypothetical protein BWY14_01016 [Parcubacteria group bacterium ADurb.Bin192]|nr:MAG: hypothetical protein BWY14_01016 [Parcubacteria group bacterium ADurb.Bin192]
MKLGIVIMAHRKREAWALDLFNLVQTIGGSSERNSAISHTQKSQDDMGLAVAWGFPPSALTRKSGRLIISPVLMDGGGG